MRRSPASGLTSLIYVNGMHPLVSAEYLTDFLPGILYYLAVFSECKSCVEDACFKNIHSPDSNKFDFHANCVGTPDWWVQNTSPLTVVRLCLRGWPPGAVNIVRCNFYFQNGDVDLYQFNASCMLYWHVACFCTCVNMSTGLSTWTVRWSSSVFRN